MMDLMNLLKVYTKAVFNPGQVLSFHCDVESWREKKKNLTDGGQFIKLFVPGALVLLPVYWPAVKQSAFPVEML